MSSVTVVNRHARELLVDRHGRHFAASAPALPEIGVPGTRHWGGYLVPDELVPELTDARAIGTYDRMRKSDPTVKAMLRALKSPLLSAQWEIDQSSDDAQDAQIADFVRWNLFEGLTHSFKHHIREALTCLDFGHSVFELVWNDVRPIDGVLRYTLKKIAPRLQRTITGWTLARDGGVINIRQSLVGSGTDAGYATIPIDKLAIYVNEQEGAYWKGQSVLRPVYKPWFKKDFLEKLQMISAERFAVGVVVVKVGADQSDDKAALDRAEAIGESIRAHEKGNVALPSDWTFELAGLDAGKQFDFDKAIENADLQILRSAHAQFLALGTGGEGSNAMSADQSSFFLQHERAIADDLIEVMNRFVIPKLVDLNWSGVRKYPRLNVRKLETRQLEKYFNAIAVLIGQRAITPDDPTEDELRALAGLRPHDKATARERSAPAPAPQPQPEGQRPGTEPPPANGGGA